MATTDLGNPFGWAAVLVSIVFFGTFGVFMKLKRVKECRIEPLVFQLYFSVFVAAIHVVFAGFTPFRVSWWGVLGAAMWVFIQTLIFVAVSSLGLAVALPMWAGLTIVVSFTWGVAKFGETPSNWALAVAGIVVLLLGVAGVALCEHPRLQCFAFLFRKQMMEKQQRDKFRFLVQKASNLEDPHQPDSAGDYLDHDHDHLHVHNHQHHHQVGAANERTSLLSQNQHQHPNGSDVHNDQIQNQNQSPSPRASAEEGRTSDAGSSGGSVHGSGRQQDGSQGPASPSSRQRQIFGLAAVLAVGLLNGSVMAPVKAYESEINSEAEEADLLASLGYVVSFAIGILPSTLIVFAAYYGLVQRRMPEFHFWQVLVPGMLTGVFWSVGSIASIIATFYLGQTVGYPLSQLAIIVASLWGIFYFREIQMPSAILIFVVSTFVIIGGAALLALFGSSSSVIDSSS